MKVCPLCRKPVTSLPKHLKSNAHGWSAARASKACSLMGLRKEMTPKPRKNNKKDVRPYKQCPESNCFAKVQRLDKHLKNVHKKIITAGKFYNLREAEEVSSRESFDSVIKNFTEWQHRGDGACLTVRTAERQGQQIRRLATVTKSWKLASLLEEERLDKYFSQVSDQNRDPSKGEIKHSYGTVVSYLFSMLKFIDYLLSTYFRHQCAATFQIETDVEVIRNLATTLKDSCKRWIRSYTRKSKPEKHAKYEEDMARLVTKEERERCLYGCEYKEVKKLREKFIAGKMTVDQITSTDFTQVRDYLLLYIYIINGHRTGLPCELKVKDFYRAVFRKGRYVLSSDKHKTLETYGSGKVVVNEEFYLLLKFYVEFVRPFAVKKIGDNKMPYLFPTRAGTLLDSSCAGAAMEACWHRCGMTRNMRPTIVRKTTTTGMYNNLPEKKAEVARLMLHQEATASKHYARISHVDNAIEGSKAIETAFGDRPLDIGRSSSFHLTDATSSDQNICDREFDLVGNEEGNNHREPSVDDHEEEYIINTDTQHDFTSQFKDDKASPSFYHKPSGTIPHSVHASTDEAENDIDDLDEEYVPEKDLKTRVKTKQKSNTLKFGRGRPELMSLEEKNLLRTICSEVFDKNVKIKEGKVKEILSRESAKPLRKFQFRQLLSKIRYMKSHQ